MDQLSQLSKQDLIDFVRNNLKFKSVFHERRFANAVTRMKAQHQQNSHKTQLLATKEKEKFISAKEKLCVKQKITIIQTMWCIKYT